MSDDSAVEAARRIIGGRLTFDDGETVSRAFLSSQSQVERMREALKPFAAGFPNTDKRDYERAFAALNPKEE